MLAIETTDLSKSYGNFAAVRALSLSVPEGQVVGILGANGAGKTTTLRMLAGVLGPTSGRIRILGRDLLEDPLGARRAIGYLAETAPLYPEMRVKEYLRFRAELKQVPRKQRELSVDRSLEQAGVADMHDVVIGHLSKGYRQRVAIADALVAAPPILILDEPTSGLDPNQIREVRALVRTLAETHTILLSTHALSEVESLCSSVIIIHRGNLVAEGPLDSLLDERSSREVKWLLRGNHELCVRLLSEQRAVLSDEVRLFEQNLCEVRTRLDEGVADPSAAVEKTVARLVEQGVGVLRVEPGRARLEEVFSALTEPEAKVRPQKDERRP